MICLLDSLKLDVFRLSLLWLVLSAWNAAAILANEAANEATDYAADVSADEQADFFHQQVEPILRQHCFGCHSHAAGEMEAGLALDWKSGWATGGQRGPAVVPGKPEDSLLIRAVQHVDAELSMPDEKLGDADIEVLVEWVRQGAFDDREVVPHASIDDDWWSLKPLRVPPVPSAPAVPPASAVPTAPAAFAVPLVASAGHVAQTRSDSLHPIDAFVQNRLAAEGLASSLTAEPRDLIRRLYFDLIGLPPTPEEVARFEADCSQGMYEQLVDQLLESPRYGERWARHWFDTIHFADSHGYEHDVGRDQAWPYRDYVIEAFNSDVPWATFIRQQLAVDFFEPEASHLLPALGFLGAGTFDYSTYQTGPVTFDYLDRDDMLTQTMAAFVSTTANCARCHAHKFDPISQDDYYALQAVFAGIVKGDIPYDSNAELAAERRRFTSLLASAQRGDAEVLQSTTTHELVANWERERGEGVTWQAVESLSFISTEGATLSEDADGVIVASGATPEVDTYVITASTSLQTITALRLELFPDDSLPMKGPGRCHNGNLHLSSVTITAFLPDEQAGQSGQAGQVVKIADATADFNQDGWGVQRAIDGDPRTAWGIHPAVGQPHHAVFELAEPLALPEGSRLTVTLKQLHGGAHLIGAFKLLATDGPAVQARALPSEVQQALDIAPVQRTAEHQRIIAKHVVGIFAESQLSGLPPQQSVYAAGANVMMPIGNGGLQAVRIATPKSVHLLKRGNIDQPQAEVPPGGLSVLQHLPSRFIDSSSQHESARRAALADWIAHRDNVLTWRSVVNRVWHFHFGRGLCDTPSDFGRMGAVPTHPELLDWLAVWFRDEAGGSLKKLHRLIVTSQTYRQTSAIRQEAAAVDADNRLLGRQNRTRLDADAYRDFVLAVSGRIDLTMGGPAIQHFHQSPGAQITPKLDYAAYDWSSPGANRRSIYRYVWRGIPDPLMSALDFPDLGLLTPARSNSVSPLQSLALYNNNFVLFHSQQLAERIAADTPAIDQQINRAVEQCLQRAASREEIEQFRVFAERHGLAALCRVLLNSSEFLFIP